MTLFPAPASQCSFFTLPHRYRTVRGKHENVMLHPSSVLADRKPLPPFVVYGELVLTTRLYMRDVTRVEESDLEAVADTVGKMFRKVDRR
jgi:hypothetical protein